MAPYVSRRTLILTCFTLLLALTTADLLEEAKSATFSNTFSSISDKIAIGSEDIATILRLSAQKTLDSKKDRSWTSKLFNILFPSSKPAVNALLATAYISGPPNFLLALCPPNINPASLSIMVAFAVGGLLGDTFFHLLPEIFLGEDNEGTRIRLVLLEPNRNLLLGVFIFIGLATFMAMDKALRIATGSNHSHSHETSLEKQAKQIDMSDYRFQDNLQKVASQETPEETKRRLSEKPYNDNSVDGKKIRAIVSDLASHNEGIRRRATDKSSSSQQSVPATTTVMNSVYSMVTGTDTDTDSPPSGKGANYQDPNTNSNSNGNTDQSPSIHKDINPSVKLAGVLNLMADFTHNITDGLALSTSFYTSSTLGATTTMAVFFHEIPHEVGDFALLIQSGFSKRKAMGAQFITAVGAFLGTIIGILVQEYGGGDTYAAGGGHTGLWGTSLQWADLLLPFTAGTFLYVGTVGVIPELLEKGEGNNRMQELTRTVCQFVAMALGALIMLAISWS